MSGTKRRKRNIDIINQQYSVGEEEEIITASLNLELLKCILCSNLVSPPLYQCRKGHLMCSRCSHSKCWHCDEMVTSCHCLNLDKIVGSMKVACSNNGCKEMIPYANLQKHENTCDYAPCSCPVSGCTFSGPVTRLSAHVDYGHGGVVKNVKNYGLVTIKRNVPFCVLRVDGYQELFILVNCSIENSGNAVSMVSIRERDSDSRFWCRLGLDFGNRGGSLNLELVPMKSVKKWNRPHHGSYPTNAAFFFVPQSFQQHEEICMRVCIGKQNVSPVDEENIEKSSEELSEVEEEVDTDDEENNEEEEEKKGISEAEEGESDDGEIDKDEESETDDGESDKEEEQKDKGTIVTLNFNLFLCKCCSKLLDHPISQCRNGHHLCVSCRKRCCEYCRGLTNHSRCLTLERLMESMKRKCLNDGCEELINCRDLHEHKYTCEYGPCFCPIPDCTFSGSTDMLSAHVDDSHRDIVKNLKHDLCGTVTIKNKDKFCVLRVDTYKEVFLLVNNEVEDGNAISITCICPKASKNSFQYKLVCDTRNGGTLKLKNMPITNVNKWTGSQYDDVFLLVLQKFQEDEQIRVSVNISKRNVSL